MAAVMSVAYLTTFMTWPLASKIGLYEAWIQISLPCLPMRLNSPAWYCPARRAFQKALYSADSA